MDEDDEDFEDLEDEDEEAFDEEVDFLYTRCPRQHADLRDRILIRKQTFRHGVVVHPSVSQLHRLQGPTSTQRSANSSDPDHVV